MRTNEKTTTITEVEDAIVKVNYFKAHDDKMVNCNYLAGLTNDWIHSKLKMDLLEFTETFDSGKSMDLAVCRLYINDEFIGEVFDCTTDQLSTGQKVYKYDVIIAYD